MMSDTETAQSTEAVASDQTLLGNQDGIGRDATAGRTDAEELAGDEAPGPDTQEASDPAGQAYADFTLPEGMEIDSDGMSEAKELFAADGLSQERAQAYVDLYTAKLKDAMEAPYKLWAETQRSWQDEVRNDREIGGARLAANLGVAAKAVDRFGGDALRQALNVSGAGNHPEVIRAFIRIGKAISEDGLVMGRGVAHDARSRADRLYPTDPLRPRD
jgi:hypothetical protein